VPVNADRPTGTGPGGAAQAASPGDSPAAEPRRADGGPPASPPSTHAADGDATWDAGDMACGELLMELRTRLRALSPGRVLHLVARDPASVIDIPAWCGLTGHALVTDRHPEYRIRRKED
jgi:tRNA 2-thiouridine synthesizing protein A